MGPHYLVMWGRRKGVRRHAEMFLASMPVMVIRHELCATPACESHAMERGDGNWVCAHHWIIKKADEIDPNTVYTPI